MRVLIIGGTGLISTAISREFLQRGQVDLTLVNRGQSAVRFPAGATIITSDRNQFAAFEAQMRALGQFDCVIDMVCFTPEQAQSAIRAFGGRTRQFIFCSTVDVYQKPAARLPITEHEPLRGGNDYGKNKVLCEALFNQAHERGDFALTTIRPAMSYGEGGKLVHMYSWGTYHILRMRQRKPLIVHGDGSALWVACHVEDVGRAFVEAAGNPATFGQAYHVTGEEWMPWNRYYEIIAEAADAPQPQCIHIPTDIIESLMPRHAIPLVTNFQSTGIFDNSKAQRDLKFRYTIPFHEGARRTISWLESHQALVTEQYDAIDDRLIAAWARIQQQLKQELADLES